MVSFTGVLTFTTNSKTIYGIFELGERTFVVESLNTEGSVVWVEIDQSQFEDIEPKIDDAQEDVKDTTRTELMLARGPGLHQQQHSHPRQAPLRAGVRHR